MFLLCRYKQAEQHLLDILREEGAVFGKPISRPHLRMAGRKHIGDTGLLDHLLKHIDGKVAPGGSERFRRWHNTDGVMEYWLESAELDDIRREAGVQDPYWVPPSWWKPGGSGALEKPASSSDIKFIKEDLFNLKRYILIFLSLIFKREESFFPIIIKHSLDIMSPKQRVGRACVQEERTRGG